MYTNSQLPKLPHFQTPAFIPFFAQLTVHIRVCVCCRRNPRLQRALPSLIERTIGKSFDESRRKTCCSLVQYQKRSVWLSKRPCERVGMIATSKRNQAPQVNIRWTILVEIPQFEYVGSVQGGNHQDLHQILVYGYICGIRTCKCGNSICVTCGSTDRAS